MAAHTARSAHGSSMKVVLFCFFVFCAAFSAPAAEFSPRRDGFAFANETHLAYGIEECGKLTMQDKETPPAFARRCLCMVRGAIQFWKYARFEPLQPRLSSADYRRRTQQLFRIPAWLPAKPTKMRIVFPGYTDLWSFSRAHRRMIQEEIGNWWPTYLRPGNWRMPCPLTRLFQGTTARAVARALPQPQALFLTKFPSMNHAVLVYAAEPLPGGDVCFRCYDPNYPGESATLYYRAGRLLHEFERRFYWPGGEVRAFRIYLSPIH